MKKNFVYITVLIMIISALFGVSSAEITENSRGGTRANDDDPGNATTVQFGDTKVDTLDNETDEDDWYKITLNAGAILILNLTVPATGDLDLYLFDDPEGWFVDVSWDEQLGGFEEITYQAGQGGLYYILCNAYDGNGQYTLRITEGVPPDNDNTPATATPINLGSPANSDLDKDGLDSQDWWKIALEAGDVINVHLTVPGTADFDLYVVDQYNSLIAYSESEDSVEEVTFGVSNTENYYIIVGAYGGSGQYTLTVTKIGTFIPDHDDDLDNATFVSVPYFIKGDLNSTVDTLDWYEFEIGIGQEVTIWLDVPDNADFHMTLRTYDDFVEIMNTPGIGVDEEIVYKDGSVRNRGMNGYYIGVWVNSSVPCETSEYTLIIDFTTDVEEMDNDNSFELATEITPPDSIQDSLNYPWDARDYYTIDAGGEREEIISVDLDIPDDSNVEFLVYDSDETWLSAANFSEDGYIEYECPEEGTYYLIAYMYHGSGAYTMDVDVISSNIPPVIASQIPVTENVNLNEGEDLRFEVTVQDEDLANLTYEWSVGNVKETGFTGNFFDVNSTYIAEFSAGLYEITVEITDSGDLSVSKTWNLTVINVNKLPEIEIKEPVETDITINETDTVTFEIDVSDIDGPTPGIQWSLDGMDLEDEDEDTYEFISDYLSAGVHIIGVNVTDSVNESLVNSTFWTVTVIDKDRAPELANMTPTGKAKTDELTHVEFSLDAYDPDGDTVSYEWYMDGKKIKDADGDSYTFVPDSDSADGETHEIMVMVWAEDLESNHTWKLDIDNVNRRPEIDILGLLPAPEDEFTAGDEIEFIIFATDPDGDDITYTLKIVEAKKSEREREDDFMNVFHKLDAGTYTINITAEDGNGGFDYYEFSIEVTEVPGTGTEETPGFGIGILLLILICLMGLIKTFYGK